MFTGQQWRILILLYVSSFLLYVDRSNLSVGAVDIQRDLGFNSYQLGLLLSAFFLTYAMSQLFMVAGWFVDRFDVRIVFAVGFTLWSGATAVTGIAQGFVLIYCLRLLLGLGESISFPSYSRILATQYPEHRRGLANAIVDAGTKSGPALGTLMGGLLMAQFGWRAFFVGLGLVSLLWLLPWFRWMPKTEGASHRETRADLVGIREILCKRSAWFSAFGLFCSNYFWYFLITWLPPYLERERQFSKPKMAVFGSLSYLAIALSTIFCGWLSDRLIARGHTPTRIRKAFTGIGLSLSTVILPVAVVRDENIAMTLLLASCVFYGIFAPNLFSMTQTMAGPRAAGKWTGFQNGFGNLAGVAAPWITGWVVQQSGQFYWAFVVAAAMALAAAAFYIFGVGTIEQVDFRPSLARQAAVIEPRV
jgi:MFS transporter, ACS family, D-galactonate transporter